MEYIENLKEYIKDNIKQISLKNHQLQRQVNVSESKLLKDFKRVEGITLRVFLIRLKINLSVKIKKENPKIKNIELMADLNYDYSEKSFRNHLKLYGKEEFDNDSFSDFFLLSKNKEAFLEVFIRVILINEFAEVKIDNGRIIIKQDVKDSIFQLFQFILPIETYHTYFIDLDVETMELSYMMFSERLIGDLDGKNEDIAYIPNHISPYFNMLYNIQKVNENNISFKLTDCIKDWDKYININKHVSTSFSDFGFYQLGIETGKDSIKINDEAFFIKETNYILDNLKDKLVSEFKKTFENKFDFKLTNFKVYLEAVKKEDYQVMESFLLRINKWNLKRTDLLFRVTCYPYLSDLDIYDYYYYIEDVPLLKKLSKLDSVILTKILINFRKEYILDDNDEIEVEELLSSLYLMHS